MRRHTLLITGLCFTLLLQAVWAEPVHTPKPGSKERKAIMDALRGPVSKTVKRQVIFKVGQFKVRDGWAFLSGNALKGDGSGLGEEHLWGEFSALLRRQTGKKGKTWKVLHWGLATDTGVMDECKKKYPQAPRSIFASG